MAKTAKFNLGNYHLTTCDMGRLVPIGLQEVLPGDIFSLRTSLLIRMLPMLAPVMHPIIVRVHHFFVPNRILWRHWGDFITSSPRGKDLTLLQTQVNTTNKNTLADYYNLPLKKSYYVNALPFLGYAMIWKDFYADDEIQAENIKAIETLLNDTYEQRTANIGNYVSAGGSNAQLPQYTAFPVNWKKDYFTSARNEPQLGDDITIPVNQAGDGKVTLTNARINGYPLTTGTKTIFPYASTENGQNGTGYTVPTLASGVAVGLYNDGVGVSPMLETSLNPSAPADTFITQLANVQGGKLTADGITYGSGLDGSNLSVSLDDLRNSMALQRIQEHRNMYGDRFVEYLAYLGVKSSDYRLQRPILLGTGKELMQISEILQTAEATGGVVGSMKGHGVATLSANRFIRGFEEHGFIHSFISIVPIALYTDGVPKMWNRQIPTDYWQKELNNLGMQPILNKELYLQLNDKDTETFGYQNIWDEYRSNQGRISGDFRDLLNDWHLAREFTKPPTLNNSFINCSPSKRIFAEQTTNSFLIMAKHRCVARRLVPKRSNPKTF